VRIVVLVRFDDTERMGTLGSASTILEGREVAAPFDPHRELPGILRALAERPDDFIWTRG
jgi:hypothetical protein